jgi:hypothetical protein
MAGKWKNDAKTKTWRENEEMTRKWNSGAKANQ